MVATWRINVKGKENEKELRRRTKIRKGKLVKGGENKKSGYWEKQSFLYPT
jgi:hypothetical protein